MIKKLAYIMLFCGLLMLLLCFVFEEIFLTNKDSVRNETRSRVLGRSKRFLVFPDGSSLQLVFCVQTSALIPVGDIFLYGSTVALAWNLPTEAKDLFMFKENKSKRRRNDEEILFTQSTQKRSAVVNPVFAKRSVDENMTFKEKLKIKIDRAKMHERKLKRDFLNKQHLDPDSVEFHRSSRVGLYEKLVPLITALGGDGRQCVLYKLCESARFSRQGTFLEEFLRVIFTLPKGKEFQDNAYREYDRAHTAAEDCAALYPECDFYLPMQSINKYTK